MEQVHVGEVLATAPRTVGWRWVLRLGAPAVLACVGVAAVVGGLQWALSDEGRALPDGTGMFLAPLVSALWVSAVLLVAVRRRVQLHEGKLHQTLGILRAQVGQLHQANGMLQAQLLEQRNHLRTVSLLEEVVVELDRQLSVTQVSDGWQRVLPDLPNVLSRNIRCLLVREEDVMRLHDMQRSFERGEEHSQSMRFLFSGKAQRHHWIEFRVLPRLDGQGQIVGYMGVLQDVTQRQDFEVLIARLTLHDPLTGLPNRALLEDRLRLALTARRPGEHRLAVLSLDVDNFKSINDALGHKTGDRVLMALGQRLQKLAGGEETVARWGGDEFSLIWPKVNTVTEVAARVDVLMSHLRQDFGVLGEHVALTASLGVALYPDDGQSVDELLLAAERAKGVAKAQGRNQVVWAEELRGQHAQRQNARLRQRLTKAVERGDIQAWFQPIVRSDSGGCDMVEVLARWHDAELGWVSPSVFIPVAEESGLISAIGQSIWAQAARQQVVWRAQGHVIQAAVNVSSHQLGRTDVTEQLLATLGQHGLPASAFVLEITESAAVQNVSGAQQRLHELRRAGFQLALDDFGTGYASLSQLHDMPINELKIDISFVRRLDSELGVSMITTIVKLAEAMGLQTIAEGVETPQAAQQLADLGVTRLQGFCFGRPMNAEVFETWLTREALAWAP